MWSTVHRRERSAAAVERAAVFLGRGRVDGIGRGDRHGRPGRGPYARRAGGPGGLSRVRALVGEYPAPTCDFPDRLQLKAVLANCHELKVLAEHVRSFGMVAHLQGDQLPTWIEAATSTTERLPPPPNCPAFGGSPGTSERDLDAVKRASHCPGTPASWKVMSTRSRCSSVGCSAEGQPTLGASVIHRTDGGEAE